MTEPTETLQELPSTLELPVNGPALGALRIVSTWHENSVEQINTLLDNAKPGVTLKMGTDDKPLEVVLNEESVKGFRIALLLALALVGTLPYELQAPTEGEFEEIENQELEPGDDQGI